MQLRVLAFSIKGLRRAPDGIESSSKLSTDDTLSVGCSSRLGDKDDMRLGGGELRCLGGNAGDVDDNDFTPVGICGARDGPVLLKVNGRPVEGVGWGDGPALGPGVGKVRREGDQVRGNEGTGDPSLSNSAPRCRVAVASGVGEGGESGNGACDEIGDGKEKEERSMRDRGGSRRAGVRSFANAASGMRVVVAKVGDGGNPMDDECPGILNSPTAAALGEPGGVDTCIPVNLTRCRSDGSMKSVEGVNDSGIDIEAARVADELNILPDGLVVSNGKPMPDP